MVVKPGGSGEGSLGDAELDAAAVAAAIERLAVETLRDTRRCPVRRCAHSSRCWSRRFDCVICGAGHDAVPLVKAAAGLGWSPIVVDDRPAFLTTERYPEAAGFVHLERAGGGRRTPRRSTSERS